MAKIKLTLIFTSLFYLLLPAFAINASLNCPGGNRVDVKIKGKITKSKINAIRKKVCSTAKKEYNSKNTNYNEIRAN